MIEHILRPDVSIVVLTGGPCGGKSSFMPAAKQWLENHGYVVGILPETATEVINAGFSPISGWADNSTFQKHLLLYQLAREERYADMLSERQSGKPRVLLCDRGVLDSLAFIGRPAFLNVLGALNFRLELLRSRYTSVIHLMSAARGAAEFYTLANNTARSESVEQAILVDRKLEEAWLGHSHYTMIDNTTDFSTKIRRALSALARVLNIPQPLEIERKYVVHAYSDIPTPFVAVDIEQCYLLPDANGAERRLRKRTLDGVSTYYLTHKQDTDKPGIRIEREAQLDLGEYEQKLPERDPTRQSIHKTRYCFLYEGQHLELDVYKGLHTGLVVLEAEVADITDEVRIPPWWAVEEVTGNKDYSNASLAKV